MRGSRKVIVKAVSVMALVFVFTMAASAGSGSVTHEAEVRLSGEHIGEILVHASVTVEHDWAAFGNWQSHDGEVHGRSRMCTGCGESQEEFYGHEWVWTWNSSQHWQRCGTAANDAEGGVSRCGATQNAGLHTFSGWSHDELMCWQECTHPSCIFEGNLANHSWVAGFCSRCGRVQ